MGIQWVALRGTQNGKLGAGQTAFTDQSGGIAPAKQREEKKGGSGGDDTRRTGVKVP